MIKDLGELNDKINVINDSEKKLRGVVSNITDFGNVTNIDTTTIPDIKNLPMISLAVDIPDVSKTFDFNTINIKNLDDGVDTMLSSLMSILDVTKTINDDLTQISNNMINIEDIEKIKDVIGHIVSYREQLNNLSDNIKDITLKNIDIGKWNINDVGEQVTRLRNAFSSIDEYLGKILSLKMDLDNPADIGSLKTKLVNVKSIVTGIEEAKKKVDSLAKLDTLKNIKTIDITSILKTIDDIFANILNVISMDDVFDIDKMSNFDFSDYTKYIWIIVIVFLVLPIVLKIALN